MANRGRGKVIPRQIIGNPIADTKVPAASLAAIAAPADSSSSSSAICGCSSGSPEAARSSRATALAVGPAGISPSQPATASTACTDLCTSGSTGQLSSWRCAAYLQRGQPQQLQPQLLGTASSRRLLAANEPVLLPGIQLATCRLTDSIGKHTIVSSSSSSAAAAHPGSTSQSNGQHGNVEVLCSPADTNRFIAADLSKNQLGSYYHLRKPETSALAMSFAEWLAAWQRWQHSRLLLQVDVCQWELQAKDASSSAASSSEALGVKAKLWPNAAVWPHLPQLLHASKAGSGDRSASLLDWSLLQQLLRDGQYQGQGGLQLHAGGRGALLPAKYETHDRLLCQVSGRQLLLLVPPEQGFQGCYPFPVAHPYDRYSCVDWEEPELQHWPAAAQVHGMVCELAPGDSLLIPAYWFVQSQLQQPACVSLAISLQPTPTKLQRPGALLMQLSRMIELWLAAEAGTANVRQWLLALAESREWQLLEKHLATPKGSKVLQVCHMVLRHTQSVLSLMPPSGVQQGPTATTPAGAAGSGTASSVMSSMARNTECEARQLLAHMCEERLMPTYWLNEGITDPLYVKHQPQHFLIQEDAEAARYPGLFSHRLLQNRRDWQQHAQQIQAPRSKLLQLQHSARA